MSLPPGFLDELRSRTSLVQIAQRKVTWDARKSNRHKGDMWAQCPFHHEKTASFHVDDRKGVYYCFGCHAKGNAISFVMDTEHVSFIEAVEILARAAGMAMPTLDVSAREQADRRTELAQVIEAAVQFFRMQLKTGMGGPARAYLHEQRGLSAEAQDRWDIGFAPDGWQGLWNHLQGKGIEAQMILDAGLAKPPSKEGGKPYDTFRNRIMFPIRDARGRAIAFGGRAMDPNANAKYLNSPETLLFDKGMTLYNHGPARLAAGQGQPLIVVEGYMDVIALVEAGFGAAVAPLGTAVTEHQLQLLWRLAPEPIIALDGDPAGLRAALRLLDLALPLVSAGQSLRFAIMPQGKDPDDLIRGKGAPAVQAALDAAVPIIKLLWQRETEGKVFDSPERRAALDKNLRDKLKQIRDPMVRSHYSQEIKTLGWSLFRAALAGNRRSGWNQLKNTSCPAPGTKASLLAAGDEQTTEQLRIAVILASLIDTPVILREFEAELETMDCTDPDYAHLRDLILRFLRHGIDTPDALRDRLSDALGPGPLENLFSLGHVALMRRVCDWGGEEMARMTVSGVFAKLKAQKGLTAEIIEAQEDLIGFADESVTYRLGQAAQAVDEAIRSNTEDRVHYEIGANGARIDRSERERFHDLHQSIVFAKPLP